MRLVRLLALGAAAAGIASCAGPAHHKLPRGAAMLDEIEPASSLSPDAAGLYTGVWTYKSIPPAEMFQQSRPDQNMPSSTGPEPGTSRNAAGPSTGSTNAQATIRTRHSSRPRTWTTTLGPDRAETTSLDADGNLVLLETLDRSHDARTAYDPPLILIHAVQEPGVRYEQHSHATVYSIQNPDVKQDDGEVEIVTEYECDQFVETPYTGPVLAHRLRTSQMIDFSRADVETTSVQWFADSLGPVWIYENERVRVLGPLGWTVETALQLADIELIDQPPSSADDASSPG